MATCDVTSVLVRAVSSSRLLSHPYYRAWEAGTLTRGDLAGYAGQYRHLERCLPEVLAATIERLDHPIRQLVEANLTDELSQPRPHLELFNAFAAAVGAAVEVPATEATARLVDLYQEAAGIGPFAALAVIGTYEMQAAEVAAVKAESLRCRYGLDAAATEFWDVHAGLEDLHSGWTCDALAALGADPGAVGQFARQSADAWWRFLDDREDARAS